MNGRALLVFSSRPPNLPGVGCTISITTLLQREQLLALILERFFDRSELNT